MSPSGAVIAFSYSGGDLVPTDTNNAQDVYVRNWQTNTLERVSLAATGTQPNSDCTSPVISADGRIVAFESSASNLLPGDTNGKRDIFIKDRLTSIVTRASVSSSGMQGSGDSWEPTMSADGRWIAFRCDSNLGTSYNGPYPTIFLHDRTTLTTVPVVVSQIGQVPNGPAYSPAISGDGRFIAYDSTASNLVANDLNSSSDVFVYDRQLGVTSRVSVSSIGAEGFGNSYRPSITFDGSSVAFTSQASNLVPGDTWGFDDVFVRNVATGSTRRASASSFGDQGNGNSQWARISADGAHVVFTSDAANLVPDDFNTYVDCFVRSEGCPLPSNYCTAGTSTNGCTPTMSASGTPSVAANSGYLLTANGVEGQKFGYLFYGVSGPSMVRNRSAIRTPRGS